MTNPLTLRGIELTFLGETKNVISPRVSRG
jgi:hypothetical protein